MATPTTLPASFTSGQVLTAAQMNNLRGAFRVLQVVQTNKTDTFTTTSTTFTDVTGISVNITPSSTTSKVMVVVTLGMVSRSDLGTFAFRLMRDSTAIGIGDAAGSRSQSTFGGLISTGNAMPMGITFLDSPNTTSSTTYKLQTLTKTGSTLYINRDLDNIDVISTARTISTITVMEISA